jgi:hypothetical protein
MDIGAAFTDSVVAALSKDEEVLTACVGAPTWDNDRRVLLLRIEPSNSDRARELADRAVELIRSIRGFRFKAEVQTTDIRGKENYIFKFTVQK